MLLTFGQDILVINQGGFNNFNFNFFSRWFISQYSIMNSIISHTRVVCLNFGYPALTSSLKDIFLQVKNSFSRLVNGRSVLKLLQLSNCDLLFLYHAYSISKVRQPRMTELEQLTYGSQRYWTVFGLIRFGFLKN